MTWDAAYYYCEALSKIEGSGITGMAKKDSVEPVGVDEYAWGWVNTLDDGSTTPSSNNCIAFNMALFPGAVSNAIRSSEGGYAMCE